MKKFARLFCLILSIVVMVGIFAGCGTNQVQQGGQVADNTNKEPVGETKQPVTINVHSWDNEYAIINATEKFNETNSDINVNLILSPWNDYQDKLFTSLAGGEDIDAYFIRVQEAFHTYASKGLIYPLDDLIAKDGFDLSIYGGYIDQLKIDGVTYAIPYRGAGTYLFYNKEAFDKAGVPYPTERFTWGEYREMTKKLTSGEGADKVYGGFFQPTIYHFFIIPALQNGVKIVNDDYTTDINSPDVREALDFVLALSEEDKSHPTYAEMKATNMGTTSSFTTGRVATVIAGEWFAGTLKNSKDAGNFTFDWGLTYLPCDTDDYVSLGLATKGCINGDAKHPEEAFEYLKFVGGLEGQAIIADAGSKPVYVNDEIIDRFAKPLEFDDFEKELYFANVKMAHEPVNLGGSYASQILTEEFSLYLTKSQDLNKTMENMYKRLDEALQELRK